MYFLNAFHAHLDPLSILYLFISLEDEHKIFFFISKQGSYTVDAWYFAQFLERNLESGAHCHVYQESHWHCPLGPFIGEG